MRRQCTNVLKNLPKNQVTHQTMNLVYCYTTKRFLPLSFHFMCSAASFVEMFPGCRMFMMSSDRDVSVQRYKAALVAFLLFRDSVSSHQAKLNTHCVQYVNVSLCRSSLLCVCMCDRERRGLLWKSLTGKCVYVCGKP